MSRPRAPMALRRPISRVRSRHRDQHDVHDADAADQQRDARRWPPGRGSSMRLDAVSVSIRSCWIVDGEIVGIAGHGQAVALAQQGGDLGACARSTLAASRACTTMNSTAALPRAGPAPKSLRPATAGGSARRRRQNLPAPALRGQHADHAEALAVEPDGLPDRVRHRGRASRPPWRPARRPAASAWLLSRKGARAQLRVMDRRVGRGGAEDHGRVDCRPGDDLGDVHRFGRDQRGVGHDWRRVAPGPSRRPASGGARRRRAAPCEQHGEQVRAVRGDLRGDALLGAPADREQGDHRGHADDRCRAWSGAVRTLFASRLSSAMRSVSPAMPAASAMAGSQQARRWVLERRPASSSAADEQPPLACRRPAARRGSSGCGGRKAAMSGSWVTRTTVMPCSRSARWKSAMISALDAASRGCRSARRPGAARAA